MLVLTKEQVRRVDRLAFEELGIPGVVLMENAGRSAARAILDLIQDDLRIAPSTAKAAILCGGGNNGGDGYVIARHLHNAGVEVILYAAKAPTDLTGDAAIHARIILNMGLPIRSIVNAAQLAAESPAWHEAHVVVDALLGTGFVGMVRSPLREVIEQCNVLAGPRIVAIDLPSGMDCDTGLVDGIAIHATVTVTFVSWKQGFMAAEAKPYLGRVVVGEIGVPPELVQRIMSGG